MKRILSLIKLNLALSKKFLLSILFNCLIIFILSKYLSDFNITYLLMWFLFGFITSILLPFNLVENVEQREGFRFLSSLSINPLYLYFSLFILMNFFLIIFMLLFAFIINFCGDYSIINLTVMLPLIVFNLDVLSLVFVVRINFSDIWSVFILSIILLFIILFMVASIDLSSICFDKLIEKIINFKIFLISFLFILSINFVGFRFYKKITYYAKIK